MIRNSREDNPINPGDQPVQAGEIKKNCRIYGHQYQISFKILISGL